MPDFELAPTKPLDYVPPSRRESFKHADSVPFERVPTGPSKADAYWLAETALLAYARPGGQRWYAHAVREYKAAFSKKTARASQVKVTYGAGKLQGANWFLISAQEFNLLVFRGSEVTGRINDIKQLAQVLKDWVLTNAQFLPTDSGQQASIHKGFLDAYSEVAATVRKSLEQSRNPNARLFITGHSLGGAMAMLACADLQSAFGPITCYTYGAPRVGNTAFAQSLAGLSVFRYEIGADLVTRVPPRGLGYRHYPSAAIHFDSVTKASGVSEDNALSTLFQSLSLGLFQFTSVLSMLDKLDAGRLSAAALDSLRPIVDHAPVLYAIATYNDWLRSNE